MWNLKYITFHPNKSWIFPPCFTSIKVAGAPVFSDWKAPNESANWWQTSQVLLVIMGKRCFPPSCPSSLLHSPLPLDGYNWKEEHAGWRKLGAHSTLTRLPSSKLPKRGVLVVRLKPYGFDLPAEIPWYGSHIYDKSYHTWLYWLLRDYNYKTNFMLFSQRLETSDWDVWTFSKLLTEIINHVRNRLIFQ